jgi:hypothetical protein
MIIPGDRQTRNNSSRQNPHQLVTSGRSLQPPHLSAPSRCSLPTYSGLESRALIVALECSVSKEGGGLGRDALIHLWKVVAVAGLMFMLNPSNINSNVTAEERRSHSDEPMRRMSSSKRGSERRGSNPERSRMLGLNRSSYALSSQCMAWSLSPMDA